VKPIGAVTRGTTNPNRLRRVDNWIAYRCGTLLAAAPDPLVVDLGYGATPVTAVELRTRLAAAVRADVHVIGLVIDPVRVAQAQLAADPPHLEFRRGGFELAGLRPAVVRAFNVLRQYDETQVAAAWQAMTATGAALIEGTCDELGRVATWAYVSDAVPLSLTLAARLSNLDHPVVFAERLPKALIHHNVSGARIHTFLRAVGAAWDAAAGPFGARQRWRTTAAHLRATGWPVLAEPHRWRLGELTVAWDAVAPP
jgi:hypothetical protein